MMLNRLKMKHLIHGTYLKRECENIVSTEISKLHKIKALTFDGQLGQDMFQQLVYSRDQIAFNSLERLVLRSLELYRTTIDDLFPLLKNIKHLECNKRQMSIYKPLLNSNIKLQSLIVALPADTLQLHLNLFLQHSSDQLQEIEIYTPNYKSLKYPKELFENCQFKQLRKFRTLNIKMQALESLFNPQYLQQNESQQLEQFEFQSADNVYSYILKNDWFYQNVIKKVLWKNGHLKEFYHEFNETKDYSSGLIDDITSLITSNIRTLRVIKLNFQKSYHQNEIERSVEIINQVLDSIMLTFDQQEGQVYIQRLVILARKLKLAQDSQILKKILEIVKKQKSQIKVVMSNSFSAVFINYYLIRNIMLQTFRKKDNHNGLIK
ncbi:UNKNOWN [Stylonychia lemnae]|uniref:Uncharacterized protein n=1 Tax=Stylonychia lemnae TaxID=5949 RepID=A0A078AKK1_STYLE|nr:UNKNOWN [Stylonychia lemnae]|eukprot:CDW82406.1 UNKNOWN [Stylonychia lemnae]